MDDSLNVLTSPAAFEEYCAALNESLALAREARLEFLAYAIERLTALKELSEKLANVEAVASVEGHLNDAKREMESLRTVSSDPW